MDRTETLVDAGAPVDAGIPVDDAAPATAPDQAGAPPAGDLVEGDLLVEDVSIDGMCGVY